MAQLQLSLSRAHKIGERLKQRMGELFSEAAALVQVQGVQGVTDAQVTKLQGQGAQAMEFLDKAEKYARALSKLRSDIGKENQSRGINAMLAELEALNRMTSNLKAMVAAGKASGVSPQELGSYKPLTSGDRLYNAGVSVVVLSADQTRELESRLAKLQREAFALSDRIAEANASRFAVEMDDEIAAEVTGN